MMMDGWQRENYEKSLSDIYKIQHTLTMQVNNAIDDFVVRSVQEYGNNENIIVNAKRYMKHVKNKYLCRYGEINIIQFMSVTQ